MSNHCSSAFKLVPEPHTDCSTCEVRKRALFRGVPDTRLSWTQQYRETQFSVKARNTLFLENTPPEFAFTLYSGWVALYKSLDDGARQILKFALPGDLLGFNLLRNGRVTHSAESITDVKLCAFPVKNMSSMLREQPDIAARLVELNTRDMAICQQHLICAARKDALARLAYLLLETYHRVRRQSVIDYDTESNSIFFPITQDLLGDSLGLTNVHVNRMMKELKRKSLIECRHRRLTILDAERLAKLAQFEPSILQASTSV